MHFITILTCLFVESITYLGEFFLYFIYATRNSYIYKLCADILLRIKIDIIYINFLCSIYTQYLSIKYINTKINSELILLVSVNINTYYSVSLMNLYTSSFHQCTHNFSIRYFEIFFKLKLETFFLS